MITKKILEKIKYLFPKILEQIKSKYMPIIKKSNLATILLMKNQQSWEFPGSPVVRILRFHCHGRGSILGKGTKIPQASWGGQTTTRTKKPQQFLAPLLSSTPNRQPLSSLFFFKAFLFCNNFRPTESCKDTTESHCIYFIQLTLMLRGFHIFPLMFFYCFRSQSGLTRCI